MRRLVPAACAGELGSVGASSCSLGSSPWILLRGPSRPRNRHQIPEPVGSSLLPPLTYVAGPAPPPGAILCPGGLLTVL